MPKSCGAAFIDANVFVHSWTTDVFLSLADAGVFEPLWSEAVLDEVREALLEMRPQAESQIRSYIGAVRRSYRYACVPEAEFATDVPELPDPGDGHVVAAAAGGGAKWVVTYNLRDFPADALMPLGLAPISPDDFLRMLLDLDDGLVAATILPKRPSTSRWEGDKPSESCACSPRARTAMRSSSTTWQASTTGSAAGSRAASRHAPAAARPTTSTRAAS